MGMSASQVRFLSLQHRKHNVGRQLNALSNRKMSLARDMQQVSRNYTNALNQINLKFSNNSGMNNYDLSYDLLMKPNTLNCETPYIITDKEGRVVVDDNEVTYEKDGQTFHTGVSYRQLAQLISSYSGVDDDGNIIYNATDRLADFSGALFGENGYSINKAATSGLACGVDNGYKIAMKQSDYDYSIAMRYDILNRLGIITEDEYNNFGAIQKAYYGTKDARDNNLYATVAINDTKGTADFFTETDSNGNLINENLKNVFGTMKLTSTGALDFEGGCTLGNIELAKKYLEELDLYLNTDIKQKATPSSSTHNTDSVRTNIKDEEYSYNHFCTSAEDVDKGITKRFIDLLTKPSVVDAATGKDLFNDQVSADGYFRDGQNAIAMLLATSAANFFGEQKSYTSTGEAAGDPYYNGWGGSTDGPQEPGVYFNGYNSGTSHNDSNPINWESMYSSKNGATDAGRDVYAVISGFYNDGDDNYVDSDCLYCNGGNLTQILRSFSNSIEGSSKSGSGMNYSEDAARYAETMTYIKFANNFRLFEWGADYKGDGTGGLEKAVGESLSRQLNFDEDRSNPYNQEAYQIHAQNVYYTETSVSPTKQAVWVGTDQNRGHNRGMNGIVTGTSDDSDSDACAFAVNLPNLINTYITFYTAYLESKELNGTQPSVAWKDGRGAYHYSISSDWSASNVDAHICDGSDWSTTSNDYVVVKDGISYSSFTYKDSDGDGKDDTSGLARALFSKRAFSDTKGGGTDHTSPDGLDDKYNVSYNVYQYLQGNNVGSVIINYSGTDVDNKYEASSLTDDEKLELDKLIYKTNSDGMFVDDKGVVLVNQSDKSLRVFKSDTNKYGEINDLCAKIRQEVHTVDASTNVSGAKKYQDVIMTKPTSYGSIVASTRFDTSTTPASILERTVTYNYNSTPADGSKLSYSEKINEKGERVASVTTAGSLNNVIASIGNDGRNGEGISVCQISTGRNTYVIGANSGNTKYCDYLYVKPTDEAGLETKLKELIKRLEEQAAEQQKQMQDSFNNIENKVMEYFDTLFKRISENGWVYDEKVNTDNTKASANYLNTMLQNNQYLLTEAREINENGKYQYAMKQATSVNKIYQVHDEDAENAALAVYESEKTAISNKERQIDTRMNMLETEQEAINTELESIKKVRNDNIDKYFKIFA